MRHISEIINKFRKCLDKFDLSLLVFLLLITDVSHLVKLIGLCFIYIVRFNFKFGLKEKRLPSFYLFISLLICIQIGLSYNIWSTNYFLIVLFSIALWIISFLIIHQLKLALEISGLERVKKTINIFFIINAIVSIGTLINIMFVTKSLNPYTFEGLNLRYQMSTGDYIKGVFRDFSTTNSSINILGFIYFFYRRSFGLAILTLLVILITTSNVNIVILLLVFLFFFTAIKSRLFKTILVCCTGLIIVFFLKITPNNLKYFASKLSIDYEVPAPELPRKFIIEDDNSSNLTQNSTATKEEKEIFANEDDNSSNLTQNSTATKEEKEIFAKIYGLEKQLEAKRIENTQKKDFKFELEIKHSNDKIIMFSNKLYQDSLTSASAYQYHSAYSGKILSYIETINFMFHDIKNFILGSGAGQFSSKVAFKASGIGVLGNYPKRFHYISEPFKENHLRILVYYFIQSPEKHSATNIPFSVYNQLLGEYGLIGFLLFIFLYIYYFAKKYKLLTYGKIILPVMMIFFATDYWFEHLSIVVIFELLMLLDFNMLKPNTNNVPSIN
jgi:hypothetical protein